MREPLKDRLANRVLIGDGCWEWTGAHTTRGYAQIKWAGKVQYAHRLMYEHFVGPIKDGLFIDHTCSNVGCCNPSHLEPVTCGENNRRTIARGRR